MPENYHDLCSTCSYASDCINHSTVKNRVFECEEFSEGPHLPPVFHESRSKPHRKVQTDCELLKGLCSDCENRDDCALRMPEGGVWHCEEYC